MAADGSSVTHGIGTVTDIPDRPYDLYIYTLQRLCTELMTPEAVQAEKQRTTMSP